MLNGRKAILMQNGTPAKSFLWKDAILLILCFVVFSAGKSATQSTMDPSEDHDFAVEAASGGMSEVKLGHLALQKGNSNAVKSFGEKMITDHTKASDDLRQIAGEESIQLPEDMPKKEQALYDRLSKLQGMQFDRAYVQSVVKDHKKDVSAFEKETSSGSDPKLKDFANRTLPTLKDHLREAKEIEHAVSVNNM